MPIPSSVFSSFKQWLKQFFAWLLYLIGFVGIRRYFSRKHAVILMYHRVLEEMEISKEIHPGMYVTRDVFAKQVGYLARKYSVVGLDQLQAWLQGKIDFPRTPCAITLDDGWDDNYRNAFPILKQYGLPATVFLITDQIDGREMLTWNQVKEMEREGIAFGSHTLTHALLKGRSREDVRRELKESKLRLRKELNCPSDWFCYPKGEYDNEAYELVKEFYAAALTTKRGILKKGDDPFQIRRIGIHNDVSISVPLFACRLTELF